VYACVCVCVCTGTSASRTRYICLGRVGSVHTVAVQYESLKHVFALYLCMFTYECMQCIFIFIRVSSYFYVRTYV